MIEIQLLGPPRILVHGDTVDIPRRKSRALLYYLAAQSGPVMRESLLQFFWPDLSRSAGQQTLRTTLYGLRKELGGALDINGQQVGIQPAVQVDTRIFLSVVESPMPDQLSLISALGLYRGDFLDTFDLPDSAEFESWMVTERERFRRLVIRAYAQLSRLMGESGQYDAALEAIEKALAFDPLQEDLQREAIRLLYLAGDRPAAIRRYDQLRKMLLDELGVPPMVETRKLYDSILNDSPQPADHIAALPLEKGQPRRDQKERQQPDRDNAVLPFTGRAHELEILASSIKPTTLVLIEGEPGIGKTRLADHFLSGPEFFPLCGAARELESGLAYQPVIEALRSLLAHPEWTRLSAAMGRTMPTVWWAELSRLTPELARGNLSRPSNLPVHDESYLWEGLRQFLHALAAAVAPRRLVLFLDDLHWADASTLGALGYLVRQSIPEETGPSFLATARTAGARSAFSTFVYAMIRENRLVRIPLPRLNDTEIETISRSISPEYVFPLSNWLAQNSEGSPLVISELVRYAFSHQLLSRQSEKQPAVLNLSALSEGPTVPTTIYSLIQSRLVQLSDSAQRTLGAAVAIGREFNAEIVVKAAAISEQAALDALDELRDLGLIHPTQDLHYEFNHPLIMEVAYQEAGELRHRINHRRVAEAMIEVHGKGWAERNAGLVAFHFSEGQSHTRAAPYAMIAGRQAARLAAWREAASFYEMAMQGMEGPDRIPAMMALGTVRQQAGQYVQSEDTLRKVIETARQFELLEYENDARLLLAHSLFTQARFDEALELAAEVYQSGSPIQKAKAEFVSGTAYSLEGMDLDSAWQHLKNSEILILEQLPETSPAFPAEIARVRFELGGIAAQQGKLEQAVSLYKSALDSACRSEDVQAMIWCILAHNNLAYHLHLLNDPQALGYLEQGLQLAREKGMLGQLPYLLSTRGEIALASGDLDTAQTVFSEGLALAERLKMDERVAGLTANLGRLDLARGNPLLATHRLSTALAKAEAVGTHHLAAQIRIWLAPLLPPQERLAQIQAARSFANSGGRRFLLKQIEELDQ